MYVSVIFVIPRESRGYRFQPVRLAVFLSVRLRVQAISPESTEGKVFSPPPAA